VVKKDVLANEVFISHGAHHELLARDTFEVGTINWISGKQPEKTNLSVKIRHGAKRYEAVVEYLMDKNVKVRLKEKDPGVASGQFAVFYDDDICLGGGVIR
jgi:tRNA-specific 2-thiouridylase